MFGRKRNNYTSFSCGGKFSPSRQWQPSTYKQARKRIPLKRLVLWKREKTLKLIITFFLTQKMRKIYVLNFSLGVRVTRNPNSLTSLVKSLTKTQGMVVIDLSHIPVNKCTNSRFGWTNYSDLYEIVHPSLVLISLCLLTGASCGKGLYDNVSPLILA